MKESGDTSPRNPQSKVSLSQPVPQIIKNNASRLSALAFIMFALVMLIHAVSYFSDAAIGNYEISDISQLPAPNSNYTIGDLIQDEGAVWRGADSLNFPENDVPYGVWIKIPIARVLLLSDLYLRFSDPLIDTLDVYVVTESNQQPRVINAFELGDTRVFSNRVLSLPRNVIMLDASDTGKTVYVFANSKISTNLHFSLWDNASFIEFNSRHTVFFGMLFGYIFALICYGIMVFATARKKEEMWFCAFLIGFVLHICAMSGLGFQYLWPQHTSFQSVVGGTTIALVFVMLVQFSQSLLKSGAKLFRRLLNTISYIGLVAAMMPLIGFDTAFVSFCLAYSIITAVMMFFLCLFAPKAPSAIKYVLCFVWVVLVLTTLISLFARYNFIADISDPIMVLVIGFYVESMIIGIALFYQYQHNYRTTDELKAMAMQDKIKEMQAKDAIVTLQRDAQTQLKEQVKAQTNELENALAKLRSATDELEIMRNVDGLTGLPNRLAFDEDLQKLVKRAVDVGGEISIAVLDIDYFKKVNDTYGHLAGDECLRRFSALLKQVFATEDYCYCRFGGEEFMLASMLPPTQVVSQLNEFREQVANLQINCVASPFNFTVSAGMATGALGPSQHVNELMSKADDNLYVAKHNGRNLVQA